MKDQLKRIKQLYNYKFDGTFINEVIQQRILTPYNCEQVDGKFIPEQKDLRCYFKTKLNNEYAIDFFTLKEPKTIFINGKSIVELSMLTTDDKEFAYLVGLSFSLKNRDRNNTKEYESQIFNNEQYEVLGRISSVVEQFINNNSKYNILFIAGDTEKIRMKTYLYMFDNQFKNEFYKYKGNSDNSENGEGFYFIKK